MHLILTPLLNAERTIEHLYESIRSQTANDWRWIISDNLSSDNSLGALKRITQDSRVSLIRQPARVPAEVNFQTLIDAASVVPGVSTLQFLASDDRYFSENSLSEILELLGAGSDVAIGAIFGETASMQLEPIFKPHDEVKGRDFKDISKILLSEWSWTHLVYAIYRHDTFFKFFNPNGRHLSRDFDWPLSLAVLASREIVLKTCSTCKFLVRSLGGADEIGYYDKHRGKTKTGRIADSNLAKVVRKLIFPYFVLLPNGLRFHQGNISPYVAAIGRLQIRNLRLIRSWFSRALRK